MHVSYASALGPCGSSAFLFFVSLRIRCVSFAVWMAVPNCSPFLERYGSVLLARRPLRNSGQHWSFSPRRQPECYIRAKFSSSRPFKHPDLLVKSLSPPTIAMSSLLALPGSVGQLQTSVVAEREVFRTPYQFVRALLGRSPFRLRIDEQPLPPATQTPLMNFKEVLLLGHSLFSRSPVGLSRAKDKKIRNRVKSSAATKRKTIGSVWSSRNKKTRLNLSPT